MFLYLKGSIKSPDAKRAQIIIAIIIMIIIIMIIITTITIIIITLFQTGKLYIALQKFTV